MYCSSITKEWPQKLILATSTLFFNLCCAENSNFVKSSYGQISKLCGRMALADHSTLGVPGLLCDVCDVRRYDLQYSSDQPVCVQIKICDSQQIVWESSFCESGFVTDSKLLRNPLSIFAANSPGRAQQCVTTVTAESKFDKIFQFLVIFSLFLLMK